MLEAVERLPYSQKQLLRQHLNVSFDSNPAHWLPALLCLHAAEALGASQDDASPAATALALIEASALVVDELVLVRAGADVPPRGLLATWGIVRPAILLPEGAETWTEDRVHAVLHHELAHIVRGDWLITLAASLLRASSGWPGKRGVTSASATLRAA